MSEALQSIGWAVLISCVGAVVGVVLVLAASLVLPHLIERMTPNLDEDKEIARGNVAVAEYFGRIVAAAIIGVSIVVAASVAAGIMAVR
jgi:uncharacterized membrane protein YjfL (UPF0719 family)